MRTILEIVLDYIEAPSQVNSIGKFEELIFSTRKKTMIEQVFFQNFIEFFEKHSIGGIKGEVVNVGLFKGGFSLFLKALYRQEETNKEFWLFDSFEGFGEMKFFSQKEQDCFNWFNSYLKKVELPTKKDLLAEFERFDLGDKLHIIEGFIEDTSDQYTRDKISLLHIDVDFYYPTLHTLISFYDKVSSGGMIIIDDYNLQQTDCKTAVNNFRLQRNITSPIQTLGNYQVAWIKE